MSALALISGVLLWAGVAVLVAASLGSVAMRHIYDRLHFVGLASTVGAPLVAVALALRADSWATALKVLLVGALLLATGPATTAVTARGRSRSTREEAG